MLNTTLDDSMQVQLPSTAVMAACRKAIADIGWRILAQDGNRVRCKEVASNGMSFNWPAEVEVIVSSVSETATSVFLNGSIFGFGPIQKSHLQGQMGNLRNRIELSLNDASKPEPVATATTFSLTEELEKLAAFYQQGVLTDREFQTAKAQLLRRSA